MPKADLPYVIGVIREQEKRLLDDEAFERMQAAHTLADAQRVLIDTPYGNRPLTSHLVEVREMLAEMVDSNVFMDFISSRYDALNFVTAILAKRAGHSDAPDLSKLGMIRPALFYSIVWHSDGIESMPPAWQTWWQKEASLDTTHDTYPNELLDRAKAMAVGIMKESASTSVMQAIANWYEKSRGSKDDDETLLDILRPHHLDPVGLDPVLAFWYAKEIEVKNIRLLLAGLGNGLGTEEVRAMRRSLINVRV